MAQVEVDELRAAIEHLARLDRASCSAGEREAAAWIAQALRERGAKADVDLERVHGSYWWPLGITSTAGIVAGLAARRGHRLAALVLGAAASATVLDELDAGWRPLRRLLPKQQSANAIGETGNPGAARTVLLVAHHDAAHTSVFFDPRINTFLGKHVRRRGGTDHDQPPMMAPIVLAPVLTGLAGLLGLRRCSALGAAVCAGIVASLFEMAVRGTVPGANDNLTGVATLLGVARALGDEPVANLRVLFVSTGAEESLMEGMRAFMARHGGELSPETTTVLCVDTVGSPELALPEAEGMFRFRRYDEELKSLIAECADSLGIHLRRGMRVRLGTDGYLALRRQIPAAMVMSVDEYGTASNYHWPSDTPENVDYDRLADAVRLCEAVVRHLASRSA